MDRAHAPDVDPRFPSGPWTGFYLQHWLPGRHPTAVALKWTAGEVEGSGADAVGPYTVAGTYDPATGRVEWRKKYLGRHSVAYRGVADSGGVWGVWEIRLLGGLYRDRGGFHLWPEGAGVPVEADRTEQAVVALMRQEFGHPLAGVRRVAGLLTLAALGFVLWRLAGY